MHAIILSTVPIYARWISWRRDSWRFWLLLLGILLIGGLFNHLFVVQKYVPLSNLYWVLIVCIIGFGLWGLNFVRERTVQMASEFVDLSVSEAFFLEIIAAIHLMYQNRFVVAAGVLFGLFTTYRFWMLQFPVPLYLELYFTLWTFVTGAVAGLGLWCAISSVRFVTAFRACDGIRFYTVAPNRSGDVVRLSKLMNQYSIIFAIEILPFVIAFVFMSKHMVEQGLVTTQALQISTYITLFFLVVVIPAYFLIPQMILSGIVRKHRGEILQDYQQRVNELLRRGTPDTWKEAVELCAIEERIEKSGSLPYRFQDLVRPLIPLAASTLLVVVKDLAAAKNVLAIALQAVQQIFPGIFPRR